MQGDRLELFSNAPGDTYRVATAASTGTAVVRFSKLLNSSLVKQTPIYAIMNGTSNVDVTATVMRGTLATSVLAGSNGFNVGTITIRQASTTANIFVSMPLVGSSGVGADTVPSGVVRLITRFRVSIVRANGSAGSATILFAIREQGSSAWSSLDTFEVQNGPGTSFEIQSGLLYQEGTDMKFRALDVSDINTIVECAAEYIDIDV